MSSRLAATMLLAVLLLDAALAQPERADLRSGRDVATLIARAELATGRGQSAAQWRFRLELGAVQRLFHQALLDVTQDSDSGALAILGAECSRLLPRVEPAGTAPPHPSAGDWQRIGRALSELCEKRDELSSTTNAGARKVLAEDLLERVRRASALPTIRVPPTIRFPNASELRRNGR